MSEKQLPQSMQHVFNMIVQHILEAKEAQCLSFTLSTDAHLVLELLDADAYLERFRKT